MPLITEDLEQCEEEPVDDTQRQILPSAESQPEQVEEATSKSRAASMTENKDNWATSVAARVLSAEDKNDWATSIVARVLSAPETHETQDRPQSSLEMKPASRVVSIVNGRSIIIYIECKLTLHRETIRRISTCKCWRHTCQLDQVFRRHAQQYTAATARVEA